MVNDDGLFNEYKDTGLVNDVFTPEILDRLGQGNIAVGHVRYGTTGGNRPKQPPSPLWSIMSREEWRLPTTAI